MGSRGNKSLHLFEVAESQQGYFTAGDAKRLGYDYPHQHFHVNRGNWIRVGHGIYRLKHFPAVRHEDLIRWWLWSRKKGVISHETAAAVYELGILLPAKIHLTVPMNFRKDPADDLILHKAALSESEIQTRAGFPITSPLRTIFDLARSRMDNERLQAVARDAIRQGIARRDEILDILATTPKGVDPGTQAALRLVAREGAGRDYPDLSAGERIPTVSEASDRTVAAQIDIKEVLTELKAGLRALYEDRLKGIFLFGSYARGDADQESDLDILVVLDTFERYALEVDRTEELAANLSLKFDVTVSLVFFREREWREGDTPFLLNVRDEAIPA